ncbi:MAG: hypothetical protein V3W09_04155 [Nitrososphaerales archaeon]
MAETTGTLRQVVQDRVRDPSGQTYTNALVIDLLSRSQRILNAGLQLVLVSGTLTTNPWQQIYTPLSTFADFADVVTVQDNGRDLDPLTLEEQNQINRQWFRRIGPSFESFTRLGRTLLAIHPAKDHTSSVTVVYAKLTTTLTADGDSVEFSDDKSPLIVDLSEALALIRERRLEAVQVVLQRLQRRMLLVNEIEL